MVLGRSLLMSVIVQERCSSNFIVNVTRNMFSETPPVAAPFREDMPITLGDIQGLQLSEIKRKECSRTI